MRSKQIIKLEKHIEKLEDAYIAAAELFKILEGRITELESELNIRKESK